MTAQDIKMLMDSSSSLALCFFFLLLVWSPPYHVGVHVLHFVFGT